VVIYRVLRWRQRASVRRGENPYEKEAIKMAIYWELFLSEV
jgi:hypothetical protein